MDCQICGNGFKALGTHVIKSHKEITLIEYYLKFIDPTAGSCSVCRAPLKFINLDRGFGKTCSLSCASRTQLSTEESRRNKSIISAETMRKNWTSDPWREKMKPVSQENIKVAQSHCDYELIGNIARINWSAGLYDHCRRGTYSKKGWYRGQYFRSSYELRSMILIHELGGSFSMEPLRLMCPSEMNKYGTPRIYIPDMLVNVQGRELLVEVKPEHEAENFLSSYKLAPALQYCEEQGLEFELWTDLRGLLAEWWKSDRDIKNYYNEVTLDACRW